jgi:Rrf2 family protein
MLSSSRFPVAVHALSILARNAGRGPVCSSMVASSVNTNPVVIRRMMGELERASLVTSCPGRSGGFMLGRKASEITLKDIYSAVEQGGIFKVHKPDPQSKCPIAAMIGRIIAKPLADAEVALERSLSSTTLDDVAAKLDE